MLNRFQLYIEQYSQAAWNWWPLEAPRRNLRPDEILLYWLCLCGTKLWKEISLEDADLIRPMLPNLPEVPLRRPRCRSRRRLQLWTALASYLPNNITRTPAHSSHTPPAGGPTSHRLHPAVAPPNNMSTANQPQQQQQHMSIIANTPGPSRPQVRTQTLKPG